MKLVFGLVILLTLNGCQSEKLEEKLESANLPDELNSNGSEEDITNVSIPGGENTFVPKMTIDDILGESKYIKDGAFIPLYDLSYAIPSQGGLGCKSWFEMNGISGINTFKIKRTEGDNSQEYLNACLYINLNSATKSCVFKAINVQPDANLKAVAECKYGNGLYQLKANLIPLKEDDLTATTSSEIEGSIPLIQWLSTCKNQDDSNSCVYNSFYFAEVARIKEALHRRITNYGFIFSELDKYAMRIYRGFYVNEATALYVMADTLEMKIQFQILITSKIHAEPSIEQLLIGKNYFIFNETSEAFNNHFVSFLNAGSGNAPVTNTVGNTPISSCSGSVVSSCTLIGATRAEITRQCVYGQLGSPSNCMAKTCDTQNNYYLNGYSCVKNQDRSAAINLSLKRAEINTFTSQYSILISQGIIDFYAGSLNTGSVTIESVRNAIAHSEAGYNAAKLLFNQHQVRNPLETEISQIQSLMSYNMPMVSSTAGSVGIIDYIKNLKEGETQIPVNSEPPVVVKKNLLAYLPALDGSHLARNKIGCAENVKEKSGINLLKGINIFNIYSTGAVKILENSCLYIKVSNDFKTSCGPMPAWENDLVSDSTYANYKALIPVYKCPRTKSVSIEVTQYDYAGVDIDVNILKEKGLDTNQEETGFNSAVLFRDASVVIPAETIDGRAGESCREWLGRLGVDEKNIQTAECAHAKIIGLGSSFERVCEPIAFGADYKDNSISSTNSLSFPVATCQTSSKFIESKLTFQKSIFDASTVGLSIRSQADWFDVDLSNSFNDQRFSHPSYNKFFVLDYAKHNSDFQSSFRITNLSDKENCFSLSAFNDSMTYPVRDDQKNITGWRNGVMQTLIPSSAHSSCESSIGSNYYSFVIKPFATVTFMQVNENLYNIEKIFGPLEAKNGVVGRYNFVLQSSHEYTLMNLLRSPNGEKNTGTGKFQNGVLNNMSVTERPDVVGKIKLANIPLLDTPCFTGSLTVDGITCDNYGSDDAYIRIFNGNSQAGGAIKDIRVRFYNTQGVLIHTKEDIKIPNWGSYIIGVSGVDANSNRSSLQIKYNMGQLYDAPPETITAFSGDVTGRGYAIVDQKFAGHSGETFSKVMANVKIASKSLNKTTAEYLQSELYKNVTNGTEKVNQFLNSKGHEALVVPNFTITNEDRLSYLVVTAFPRGESSYDYSYVYHGQIYDRNGKVIGKFTLPINPAINKNKRFTISSSSLSALVGADISQAAGPVKIVLTSTDKKNDQIVFQHFKRDNRGNYTNYSCFSYHANSATSLFVVPPGDATETITLGVFNMSKDSVSANATFYNSDGIGNMYTQNIPLAGGHASTFTNSFYASLSSDALGGRGIVKFRTSSPSYNRALGAMGILKRSFDNDSFQVESNISCPSRYETY